MPSHSGNAPCPCGSGRKSKHCCLPRQRVAPANYTRVERELAIGKLLRYSTRPEFREFVPAAQAVFLDREPAVPGEELELDETTLSGMLDWIFYDLPVDQSGDTIVRRLLADPRQRLDPGERTWLTRMSGSEVRLYEITAVRLEEGFELRDLWSGEKVFVAEKLGTRQLGKWTLLAARVIEGGAGVPVMEGMPCAFPPDERELLMKELKAAQRRIGRRKGAAPAELRFKELAPFFHDVWSRRLEKRMPQIRTVEGDPVGFTRTVFDLKDRTAAVAVLDDRPEFERAEDGVYIWGEREPGTGPGRVLGDVRLTGNRLELSTMSEARARRGRALLEAALGGAIRFRLERFEGLEEAMARLPPEPERHRRGSGIPPEVEQEVVGGWLEKHYREWVDVPVPALGGRTPRHAATLKTVRPRVVELIKQIESGLERERRAGRPSIDVSWLWKELGIDPGDG